MINGGYRDRKEGNEISQTHNEEVRVEATRIHGRVVDVCIHNPNR